MARKTSIVRSVALAAVLAVGFAVVIGATVGWTYSFLDSMTREILYYSESVCFLADGTPLIIRYQYRDSSETLYDLDHREIKTGRKKRPSTLPQTTLLNPWNRWRLNSLSFPLESGARVRMTVDQGTVPVFWYFVHDGRRAGRGYFEGFDSVTYQRVGYIGLQGRQTTEPTPEEQFPVDGAQFALSAAFSNNMRECRYNYYWHSAQNEEAEIPDWKVVMITGGRLAEVDLREGTVRPFGEVTDPLSVGEYPWYHPPLDQPAEQGEREQHQDVAVRTEDHILLLYPTGKLHKSYVIPEKLRGDLLDFWIMPDQEAVLEHHEWRRGKAETDRSSESVQVLTWIDADGKVLREKTAMLEGSIPPEDPYVTAWMLSFADPAPLGQAMITAGMVSDRDRRYFEAYPTYGQALAQAIGFMWPSFVFWSLVSLVLAAWCYRRQRRYAQPGAATWAVFVLLFGPAGLLAYRFHRRWPVLETCTACGKAVPRDRLACAACNSMFPAPPRRGTEVFA